MNHHNVEYCELAPGFRISRVLTGLWQIADMERGGRELDPDETAAAMAPYAAAGLSTFDMADHYGSAEIIAGTFRRRPEAGEVQLLTKWVPPPGAVTRAAVRAAVQRALDRLSLLFRETEALYHSTTISPQLCELRNLITIAYLISRAASMRHESRGLHYTTDYPEKQEFVQRSVL